VTNKNFYVHIRPFINFIGKISKIGATRCQILRLKCSEFNFRWGSAPNLVVFKGTTSKGREGKAAGNGRGGGKGRRGGENGIGYGGREGWERERGALLLRKGKG